MVRISGTNRNRNSCSDSTKGKIWKNSQRGISRSSGSSSSITVVVVVVAVVVVVGVQGSYHRKTLECSYYRMTFEDEVFPWYYYP